MYTHLSFLTKAYYIDMNISPWNNINGAFDPMFDETIMVKCNRTDEEFSQTLNVFVATNMSDDTILDDVIDTDREEITIFVSQKDWAYIDKIQRGDLIVRPQHLDQRYSVSSVVYDNVMGYQIVARGI